MFRSAHSTRAEDSREQVVIAPHHQDRLRRPLPRAGAVGRELFHQSLIWNVFRTLELLPPAFWLRRLHARLVGDALPGAPQIVRIRLWQPLQLPPVLCLDGARADVVADVVIETEHAMWSLVAGGGSSQLSAEGDGVTGDMASRIIDAGAWHAGRRRHYFGVIEIDEGPSGEVLMRRLSRSKASVHLRSRLRDASAPVAGVGVIQWTHIATILTECERAGVLSPIERALARNARRWLDRVGVRPAVTVEPASTRQ